MPYSLHMLNPDEAIEFLDAATMLRVARMVISDPTADVGQILVEPIAAVHNDQRTVAILRVSGKAPQIGSLRPWSAIVKVIDPSIPPDGSVAWNYPELEERVYAGNLFSVLDVPFRAAHCYMVERTSSGHMQFWLEDMTNAIHPPWTVDQYSRTAYNLGRFNGHYAVSGQLPGELALPTNNFTARWQATNAAERLGQLGTYIDAKPVQSMFTAQQVATVVDVANFIDTFVTQTRSLPTALAHGDSHARNLFPVADHTVAIDWAGVANEPLGADAGVLIGSGLTWGVSEAQMIMENVESIYSRYVEGLMDSGWSGRPAAVRTGFFAQFAIYMIAISAFGVTLASGAAQRRRELYEARLGSSLESMPDRLGLFTPLLMRYFAEFRSMTQ